MYVFCYLIYLLYLQIRKQAIKDLPSVCKVNKEHLSKVSDVLVQLLQTDDTTELSMVQVALVHLLELDTKGMRFFCITVPINNSMSALDCVCSYGYLFIDYL